MQLVILACRCCRRCPGHQCPVSAGSNQPARWPRRHHLDEVTDRRLSEQHSPLRRQLWHGLVQDHQQACCKSSCTLCLSVCLSICLSFTIGMASSKITNKLIVNPAVSLSACPSVGLPVCLLEHHSPLRCQLWHGLVQDRQQACSKFSCSAN